MHADWILSSTGSITSIAFWRWPHTPVSAFMCIWLQVRASSPPHVHFRYLRRTFAS